MASGLQQCQRASSLQFTGVSRGRAHRGGVTVFRVSSGYQSAGGDELPATRLPGGHTCVHRHPERSISQLEPHGHLHGLGGGYRLDLLLPGDGEETQTTKTTKKKTSRHTRPG